MVQRRPAMGLGRQAPGVAPCDGSSRTVRVAARIAPAVRSAPSMVTPTPAAVRRSAFSGWSAEIGRKTIGRPWPSAALTVP